MFFVEADWWLHTKGSACITFAFHKLHNPQVVRRLCIMSNIGNTFCRRSNYWAMFVPDGATHRLSVPVVVVMDNRYIALWLFELNVYTLTVGSGAICNIRSFSLNRASVNPPNALNNPSQPPPHWTTPLNPTSALSAPLMPDFKWWSQYKHLRRWWRMAWKHHNRRVVARVYELMCPHSGYLCSIHVLTHPPISIVSPPAEELNHWKVAFPPNICPKIPNTTRSSGCFSSVKSRELTAELKSSRVSSELCLSVMRIT